MVTIISDRKQGFLGKNYYKTGKYFQRREPCAENRCGWKTVLLHREVWIASHGDIPAGHHIHHIDGDTSNNSIENLDCVSPGRHANLHFTDERREKMRRWMLDHVSPKAAAWHRSRAGKRWHRAMSKQNAKLRFVPRSHTCILCGSEFVSRCIQKPKYCSNKCRNRGAYMGKKQRRHANRFVCTSYPL